MHIGFSRGRSGGLVFPTLSEFSTVYCDPHSQRLGIVNKAEIDVFLELSCFSMIQRMLAIWSLVPLLFLKPTWTSGSSRFTYCWSLAWRILSITLLVCEMSPAYSLLILIQKIQMCYYAINFTNSSSCNKGYLISYHQRSLIWWFISHWVPCVHSKSLQ